MGAGFVIFLFSQISHLTLYFTLFHATPSERFLFCCDVVVGEIEVWIILWIVLKFMIWLFSPAQKNCQWHAVSASGRSCNVWSTVISYVFESYFDDDGGEFNDKAPWLDSSIGKDKMKMWLLWKRYERLNLISLLMGRLVHYFFAYRGFKMFAVVWCWCCFCFAVLLQCSLFAALSHWLIISRRSQWQPVDLFTEHWLNGMNRKHNNDRFSVAYYDDGHQAMMNAAALRNLLSSRCTTLSVKN